MAMPCNLESKSEQFTPPCVETKSRTFGSKTIQTEMVSLLYEVSQREQNFNIYEFRALKKALKEELKCQECRESILLVFATSSIESPCTNQAPIEEVKKSRLAIELGKRE